MIPLSAQTTTVYRSVDASGTVRFSDRPPVGDDASVEVIRLATSPPVSVPDSQQLIADMAATTERLRQDRLRRTEERAPTSSPILPAEAGRYSSQTRQAWYYPGPYRHGYPRGPAWHPPDRSQQKPQPDTRTERDRRRADMEGTWVIPRQLPGSVPPPSGR